ncbi:MAG TPA: glycosyltransferase family 4 protein [Flavobacterium sp.]|jgi:glycosyltransferase involved in cell wall biosynthesis
MKKLLYIGNKLSAHGNTTTSIERLGALLEGEGYKLLYASSKQNKAARLVDMILNTLKHKVDYVLIDTYSTSNFWYAFVISCICRILGRKYIPILHGGNLPNRLKADPGLCNMIFRSAFVNIAPSNYLLSNFQNAGFSNTIYIPNSIDVGNYPHLQRQKLEPKLLWVRSLASIYNPKMALEVLSILQREFSNASLCMVGPDKQKMLPRLKNIAETQNLNVTFAGRMSKPEWIALAADYDIFINTTHFDNTPVSVIEAMALGLPVVTTNVGGIPFLIDDQKNGLLVDDDDAVKMASAIRRLISDQKLAAEIAGNARRMAESFDWELVKQKWNEILR